MSYVNTPNRATLFSPHPGQSPTVARLWLAVKRTIGTTYTMLKQRGFSISAGSRIVGWVSRPVAGRVWTGLETRSTFHSTHLLSSHK